MAHNHQLVQQNMTINTALSTLASRTALTLNSILNGITNDFLVKQYRMNLHYVGRTAADDGPVIVCMNKGDATAQEVKEAFDEQNTAGPDDTTQMLTQDRVWTVYQNTVHSFRMYSNTEGNIDTGWIPFGGKNGIPIIEGVGLAVHAFNSGGGALTTGGTIAGSIWLRGVWLHG